jgi:UDPglucose--hexose-1-phosphate uridylyltransferase
MVNLHSPHRRQNLLTGEWVLVSPQRTQRPWQGKVEALPGPERPRYDPTCYLCPGNQRAGAATNPLYTSTYVFTNDFAALLPEETTQHPEVQHLFSHPMLATEEAFGTCRVICFSPRHDLTLPEMTIAEIKGVIDAWAEQTEELGRQYRWIQVFENKGELMGCSNPHPHGQVWAGEFLPNEALKEEHHQHTWFQCTGNPLLQDYLECELSQGERIVVENQDWIVLVPYWALWPFETLLLPKHPVLRLPDLTEPERFSLADILKKILIRYDNLFEISFPYSMGWHGAPYTEEETQHWWLHAHFYPPLLRSATIRKFMVGYEMLSEPQRDITPEIAAQRLRDVSEQHYRL